MLAAFEGTYTGGGLGGGGEGGNSGDGWCDAVHRAVPIAGWEGTHPPRHGSIVEAYLPKFFFLFPRPSHP